MIKVKRALVSVSDKTGILDFAKGLASLGIEIVSTGGTARLLAGAGVAVREISDYTGFPEILDGRVKTLHPAVHGGLLALRENPRHLEQLQQHHIGLIDLVVVNLYPFERVTDKKNVTLEEAVENIDIGGPSMLRSAAKNFKNVAVVCHPGRYEEVLRELTNNNGLLPDSVLINLAIEVFQRTSRYDQAIFDFLNKRLKTGEFSGLAQEWVMRYAKARDLRYGENPHQQAAFYVPRGETRGLAGLKQHHGKDLSFNNYLDLDAAVGLITAFAQPAAVVIKHNNPTGVCEDETLAAAFRKALTCDPVSAFGGIIGLNRKVDPSTARLIAEAGFMECVVAPGYTAGALKLLTKKKNLRLMELDFQNLEEMPVAFRQVDGGLLLQEKDRRELGAQDLRIATKAKPTPAQLESLLFGWKVVRHVRSNAVILVKGKHTVGIGCGQTSRVESLQLAIRKAGKNAKGSLMVSDAFLPKVDNIQVAAKAGIKAIIQSGGSIADEDVVRAADRARIAMVMTGVRHFKH